MSIYAPSGLSEPHYMDEKIKDYMKLLETVTNSERPNLHAKLLSVRLLKEKLVAMTALAKAQSILAEMDLLVAENNLKTALEQLDQFTKVHEPYVPAEKKINTPESSKSKSQKEPNVLVPIVETANDTKNSLPENKNNANKAIEKVTHTDTESQIVQKSSSHTLTKKPKKRKHSNSHSKSKHEKRCKTSHDTAKALESDKKTLQNLTLSPISKVPTSSLAIDMDSECDQQTKCTKHIDFTTHRILQDDENTVLLEDLPVKRSSHHNAITLSKALQKVMPPKDTARHRDSHSLQDDLSQCPRLSKMKLLFEDEPNFSRKAFNVKTEVPESDLLNKSTDNLINDLFRDIMEAKLQHVAMKTPSPPIMSGVL